MVNSPEFELTAPHRKLHALLVDLGLEVEDEYDVGVYSLDCYLPEVHLGIEYDGAYHETRKQRQKDKIRDIWLLEKAGIPVFRVKPKHFANKAATEIIIEILREWIEEESIDYEERLKLWKI